MSHNQTTMIQVAGYKPRADTHSHYNIPSSTSIYDVDMYTIKRLQNDGKSVTATSEHQQRQL